MAILSFQQPEKVIMLESTATVGKFEFRPLEPGYAVTIGNALRRVLLSALEGYAIASVKIEGVDHEFASIPGVMEDVVNIILNLKQVRFKKVVDDTNSEHIKLNLSGKTEFKAGMLSNELTAFKVLNPDLVICHMESAVKLQMELTINKGRGYVEASENRSPKDAIGVIAVDSIYTPIKNVNFTREAYRVEQKTDYDKLILDIVTDGSIAPKDALKEAAKILIHHFMLFSDEKITIDMEESLTKNEFNEEILRMRQLLKSRLADLDLSVRALNCLKTAEVETLGELVRYQRNDLLKFRNFGKKSLVELDEKLAQLSLNFGMDVAKYKLDKD
ncbi:DNA-directed RNA polymerase subunit alpha [Bacteroidia bacterium]|nr:DNA-directed RNA polymerase subunit alpha [Bacteroidia bacterium]